MRHGDKTILVTMLLDLLCQCRIMYTLTLKELGLSAVNEAAGMIETKKRLRCET